MREAIAHTPAPVPVRSRGRAFARAALMLALATAMAIAGTLAISAFVLRAESLTFAAELVNRAAFAHGAIAISIASSPIVAVLLVGYAYMQRGLRRRAAARARAAAGP